MATPPSPGRFLSAYLKAPFESLRDLMNTEIEAAGRAIERGVNFQAVSLQLELRRQTAAAGFRGNAWGLTKAWQIKRYGKGKGAKAVALVYSKAPRIMSLAETGGTLRPKTGKFLVIPLPGIKRRKGAPPPELRDSLGQKGVSVAPVKRDRRKFLVIKKTRTRVTFLFLLVKQTQNRKRIDFAGAARKAKAGLPEAVLNFYEES